MGVASVRDFFNDISGDYDATIRRTIPPYQEMFEALVGYTFVTPDADLNILELGCGTGNLSLFLKSVFPNARMTLMDLSPDMLRETGAKLAADGMQADRFALVEGGFMEVKLPDNTYDLIVSSVALHHLQDAEKPGMYRRIHGWLKPGGLLRVADEVKTLPEAQAMEWNMNRWKAWSRENGATEEELNFWVDHGEKYDHYATLAEHFQWLSAAGFTDVDCYWKRVLWSVFGGRKQA